MHVLVQAVAKRLEKMLETALNQLKLEQKMRSFDFSIGWQIHFVWLYACFTRKDGDNKLIDLELSLVNAEHALKSAEERHREEVLKLVLFFGFNL